MAGKQENISPMIRTIRTDFVKGILLESEINKDPFSQFKTWLEQAFITNGMANAMVLSTVDSKGLPDSRVMLLRDVSEEGFTFYTNYKSKKGSDLLKNPQASLLFFWQDAERQVRISGTIKKLSKKTAIEYFATRPFESQVGAIASAQSSIIESRTAMDEKFEKVKKQFEGKPVPMPDHWGGFVLKPHTIEFWQGRANRMHDRIKYTKLKSKWKVARLMP
jgi:pyridoxamine 5'-phosphate oxidase